MSGVRQCVVYGCVVGVCDDDDDEERERRRERWMGRWRVDLLLLGFQLFGKCKY